MARAHYPIANDDHGHPKRLSSTITFHWMFMGMTQGPADLPISPEDVSIVANPHLAPGERGKSAAEQAGSTENIRLPFVYPKYPRKAWKEGRQGNSYALLAIDSRGRVERCSVVRTSGHADLDAAACGFARKTLRYVPARNASGQVIPSSGTFSINWRINSLSS